jgi:hypothetical protein
MSTASNDPKYSVINWRLIAFLIAGMGITVLVAANAHLVYVALDSQPDCVPHAKAVGEKEMFRAARSAC